MLDYRSKYILRKMSHGEDHHAVAGQMIGLIISLRQNIVVGKAHQPRRLARRNQSRSYAVALDDQHELPAGAARRRAQAPRHAVKARLGALNLLAKRIVARAAIGG